MLHQPGAELILNAAQSLRPVAQQHRHHLGDAGSGHQQPHHIAAAMHAAAGGQIEGLAAVQQGDPAQGQAQVVGGGEQQVGAQHQLFNVDVRLVEAVEQHQAIGARQHQAAGHGAQVGEEGAELHRQGQAHLGAHLAHDLLHLGFDRGAAELGIGGQGIDVQLQGRGAGGLDAAGRLHPAAGVTAVEAGDHRDRQLTAGLLDQAQIGVRPLVHHRPLGQVAEGLAVALLPLAGMPVQGQLLLLDLLLEQRMQHHRGGALRLQFHQLLHVLAEGQGRPHHQGRAQRQTQVAGAQIGLGERGGHGWPSAAEAALGRALGHGAAIAR